MSVYVGKSGSKKEITEVYIGKSGVKSVSEGYALKNGTVTQVYSSYIPEPGQQIFTTSGIFTVPKGVKSVDVFLVGGGGMGGTGMWTNIPAYTADVTINTDKAGCGGGGGYTTTKKGISVKPGEEYSVVVGAASASYAWNEAYRGGSSSAFYQSALGGYNGRWVAYGHGGSGGGAGGEYHTWHYSSSGGVSTDIIYPGRGGSDGSNGWTGSGVGGIMYELTGGTGQGTTTRAFGESTGTLYAGGGGGAPYNSSDNAPGGDGGGGRSNGAATAGTGGGGGGSSSMGDFIHNNYWHYSNIGGYAGGSGCVIIRWGYN